MKEFIAGIEWWEKQLTGLDISATDRKYILQKAAERPLLKSNEFIYLIVGVIIGVLICII